MFSERFIDTISRYASGSLLFRNFQRLVVHLFRRISRYFSIFDEVSLFDEITPPHAIDAQRDGNSISIELAAATRGRGGGGGAKSKDKFYKNRPGGERHRIVVEIHRWISYPSMFSMSTETCKQILTRLSTVRAALTYVHHVQTRRRICTHTCARRTLCAKIRSDEACTHFAGFELLFAGV